MAELWHPAARQHQQRHIPTDFARAGEKVQTLAVCPVQVFEQKDDGDPSEAPMRRNSCAAALKARLRIFLASSRMPGTCERRPCADVRS
jgi:hypothetical protein